MNFTTNAIGQFSLSTAWSAAIATYTAAADKLLILRIRFDELDGANEEYELRLSITSGAVERPLVGTPWSMKEADEGRYVLSSPIPLADGETLKAYVRKLNGAAEDVTGEAVFADVTPLSIGDLAAFALEATAQAIKARTDNLPDSPAAVGSAMTLTAAYDAAKTAAQPGDMAGLALESTSQAIGLAISSLVIPTPADNAAQVDIVLSAAHGAGSWSTGNGTGDVEVTHDYGGADALRYVDGQGAGVDGGIIRAYLKADYDAGSYNVRGTASTGSDGRWTTPIYLDAGDYVLTFSKPGVYATTNVEVTVA